MLTMSCFELYNGEVRDLLKEGDDSAVDENISTKQLKTSAEAIMVISGAIERRKCVKKSGASLSHLVLTLAVQ